VSPEPVRATPPAAEIAEPAAPHGSGPQPAWVAYGRIVTNFIHDLSTGVWFACVLVIWVIGARTTGAPPEATAVLYEAMGTVFWLLVASLVGIAVTGGLRLLYWRKDTAPELVARKRRALIAKHAAFLLVYGAGTVLAAMTVFSVPRG
jgi:hypothetical protein